MAKHTLDKNLKHGISVDENDSTWIVTVNGSITDAPDQNHETAVGMYEDDQVSGNHFIVNGKITALGDESIGIYARGDDTEVDIGKNADIHANYGIWTDGPQSEIDNQGEITASLYGISAMAAKEIINGGEISAGGGIRVMSGNVKIVNDDGGEIWGVAGIDTGGTNSATLINKGMLSGSSRSIIDGDGELKVINRGSIYGDIDLGAGDDRFENRGGDIMFMANIEGGEGNDTFRVDRAAIFVHENSGEGNDTIVTCSNYKLMEVGEIETLKAVGKKDVNLGGDLRDTTLIGNVGNNKIHADDGKDYIRGGAGNDQLFGEGGEDTFVFGQGCDNDVIRDFAQGEDTIELDGFEGMTFMELSDKITDTDAGMVIDLGMGDTILLKGFHDALTVDDFLI